MPTEDLSFFQEEEFKKNLALYEQMIQGGQSVYLEADELTDIAEYYLIKNKKDSAFQCIEYALNLHPDSVDPLIFLARQRMFNGEIEEAKKIRDSISDQNDREVVFLNAELLLRERKEKEAHIYLMQWGEEGEMDDKEEIAMYAYDCACLFGDYGFWERAHQWNNTAAQISPDNHKILRLKAEIYVTANQPQRAIDILNKLLDENPYNLTAWQTLGEAYFQLEDYTKTLETTDFALAINENDEYAMLLKANCHFHQQHFLEAHDLYTAYIREYPTNELPYLFDGVCLLALERIEEALTQLLHAEKLSEGYSPEQLPIYSNIADAYNQLGMLDQAFIYMDKIHEINPDYNANLYKAHALMEHKHREEGMAYYEKFIHQNSNPDEAHFFVGMSLVENKEYEEARKHFLHVTDYNIPSLEKNNKTDACMAFCTLVQNKFEEFLYYLERACQQDPDTLRLILGNYMPSEVAPEDFYQYVLSHPDHFQNFNPKAPENQA